MRPEWFPDWSGKTIIIIASGPSLTLSDCALVEQARATDRCRVIAVNSSFRRAPFADLLYSCEAAWWRAYPDAYCFPGLKVGMAVNGDVAEGIHSFQRGVTEGFEADPSKLATGRNSGFQAINLAYHFGACRILLLGFDMKSGPAGINHWHGNHAAPLRNPMPSSWPKWIAAMEVAAPIIAALGIDVVNCSRDTALNCFRRSTIDAEI